MVEIVLATANPHKVKEMKAIFSALAPAVRLIGLDTLAPGPIPEPAEVGSTFEENSEIKAIAYARATGRVCLADDSGLEIDALGGRPGVISSHYCTDGREAGMTRAERDGANNNRVLRELEGIESVQRSARFVCTMTLGDAQGRILGRSKGTFEGRIGIPPRVPSGHSGFGYDPLFLVAPDFLRTSSELPPEEKNLLSHRRRAAEQMARIVETM
ncbi:MAG: non-canonical purine NTP pyrophosphatase [Phycisphaeraceae bacterium]|nr:non-canonical purine NTP pyrophosphatase [Phycisphaeraceae bacterium]